MNLGINNTAFKGFIQYTDGYHREQKIDTNDIQAIGAIPRKYADIIYIKTKKDRGFDAPDGSGRYIENCHIIESDHIQKDYDNLLKVYDIASRNNITIYYLNDRTFPHKRRDIDY